MNIHAMALGLHAFLAVVWVGGMFFAYFVLRHSIVKLEPAPERLKLWARTFQKFFPWVWMAAIGMPLTGHLVIGMTYQGGLAAAPRHVVWMITLGYVMIVIYLFLQAWPYRKFKRAVAEERWPGAADQLNMIRRFVATNMWLGVATTVIAITGHLWA